MEIVAEALGFHIFIHVQQEVQRTGTVISILKILAITASSSTRPK